MERAAALPERPPFPVSLPGRRGPAGRARPAFQAELRPCLKKPRAHLIAEFCIGLR